MHLAHNLLCKTVIRSWKSARESTLFRVRLPRSPLLPREDPKIVPYRWLFPVSTMYYIYRATYTYIYVHKSDDNSLFFFLILQLTCSWNIFVENNIFIPLDNFIISFHNDWRRGKILNNYFYHRIVKKYFQRNLF